MSKSSLLGHTCTLSSQSNNTDLCSYNNGIVIPLVLKLGLESMMSVYVGQPTFQTNTGAVMYITQMPASFPGSYNANFPQLLHQTSLRGNQHLQQINFVLGLPYLASNASVTPALTS